VHTLLIYLDQDEIVLVTLQAEFSARDVDGRVRRVAYVERRIQSFPHLNTRDLPSDVTILDVQPARSDCRYVMVGDTVLRSLREIELGRSADRALDGASAHEAIRDMKAAVAAIPATLNAQRAQLRLAAHERSGGSDESYASWTTAASLALLEESHADLAARIRAASKVLERYAVDPTRVETADLPAGDTVTDDHRPPAPSGMWRQFYDRPRRTGSA
jgi:hypothetical protein